MEEGRVTQHKKNELPPQFKNFHELYRQYVKTTILQLFGRHVNFDGGYLTTEEKIKIESNNTFRIIQRLPDENGYRVYEEYTFDMDFVKARAYEYIMEELPTKQEFLEIRNSIMNNSLPVVLIMDKKDAFQKFSNFFLNKF